MLDQVQAGGRIPLIIGRGLTNKARESLNLGMSTTFQQIPGCFKGALPDFGSGFWGVRV